MLGKSRDPDGCGVFEDDIYLKTNLLKRFFSDPVLIIPSKAPEPLTSDPSLALMYSQRLLMLMAKRQITVTYWLG